MQSGDEVIVGVNRYQSGESEPIELHRIDPDAEQRQVERTQAVRAERDAAAWEAALAAVRAAAGSDANVLAADARGAARRCDGRGGVRGPARGLGHLRRAQGARPSRGEAREWGACAAVRSRRRRPWGADAL